MLSQKLLEKGFIAKPILSPTVPEGQERLRVCLHIFNVTPEIEAFLRAVKEFY